MNLEFIREIFMTQVKNGNEMTQEMIEQCFDKAEIYEHIAIQRGYIIPDYCDKCKTKLNIIDVSMPKDPEFRVQCPTCNTIATGKTTEKAITNFWSSK